MRYEKGSLMDLMSLSVPQKKKSKKSESLRFPASTYRKRKISSFENIPSPKRRRREPGFSDLPPWLQISILFVIGVLVIWAFYGKAIEAWFQQNLVLFIFIAILVCTGVGWALLKYWQYKKQKETQLIFQVTKRIEEFQPSKNWSSEEGYHGELQGYLKSKFPNSKVEIQTGASRPDIIIENIAIEIKGPTDDQGINSLGTKCLKYSQYYNNLIIVLFQCSFSESNYREIIEGIRRYFPNVQVVRK